MERIPSQGIAAKRIIAMRFSTEAIVALVVAIVFALLSFGAIAREQGQEPRRSAQSAYVAPRDVNLTQVASSNMDVLAFY